MMCSLCTRMVGVALFTVPLKGCAILIAALHLVG